MRPPGDKQVETLASPAFTRPSASGVVLLGLSPKNGYYNRENITAIVQDTLGRISTGWTVRPFVPEGPLVWTYLALGYSETDGLRSARRHSGEKRRQARAAAAGDARFKDCCWDDLIGGGNNPLFRAAVKRLECAYETNAAFKRDVHEATLAVLEKQGVASEEAVRIGCRYLIEEFASLARIHDVLEVDEIVFVYHKHWSMLERVFEGAPYGLPKISGASMTIVSAETAEEPPAP